LIRSRIALAFLVPCKFAIGHVVPMLVRTSVERWTDREEPLAAGVEGEVETQLYGALDMRGDSGESEAEKPQKREK
jgi:hypothetical protein